MASDVNEPSCAEHLFACHNAVENKISTSYICIICGNIYHRKCAARKSKVLLSSSFIICCENLISDVNTRDIVEENKIKRLAIELVKFNKENEKLKEELSALKNKFVKFETLGMDANSQDEEAKSLTEDPNDPNVINIGTEDPNVLKITNKYLLINNKDLRSRISDLNFLNKQLFENNEMLKEKIENQCVSNNRIPITYTQAVTQFDMPTPHVNVPSVILKPSEGKVTDTVYKKVQSILSKSKNLHINSCFKTSKNVIIKCESKKDNDSVLDLLNNNQNVEGTAEIEKLRNPRIRMVGISIDFDEMTDEDFIDDIKTRNSLSDNHFIKICYRYKNLAKKNWNIIFEVNSLAYTKIMQERKLFFGCSRYRVFNDFNITICTKCCKYGHSRNRCRNQNVEFCTFCAGNHLNGNCLNKESPKCKICQDFNKNNKDPKRNVNHSAMDFKNCPSYDDYLNYIIKNTDYPFDPRKME